MDSVTNIKVTLVVFLIATSCIHLSTAKCLRMDISLYCTNLGNGTENEPLILQTDDDMQEKDIQMIYLQNSFGSLNEKSFSNFRNMRSLDVQFSNISHFSQKKHGMNVLYLMNNLKFPTLSADFMNMCCQNVSTLIIMNNQGLKIDTGAFEHMTNLTHLTISQQNITNLTRDFFEGLEKLTYLNLEDNGIVNIDENAFENLTEMNRLILSDNNFARFEQNTFVNLKVLETIEIYNVNLSEFNISIFNNQKELKVLGLPKGLIKTEKIKLNELTKVLPKLEYFGFLNTDTEDADLAEFIKKCKARGYNITYT